MDLVNDTPFPARVARAILPYRSLMLATVVAKCGFEVSPGGVVSPAADQLAVEEADVATPYGSIDGDMVPIKHGCDFALMGLARPLPGGRAVTTHEVRVRVGDFARRWRVSGDWRWTKTAGGYEASPAEPFTEMVLGYDKAYGGTAIWQRRQKVGCYENPDGKGFVVREEDVDGLPLPNLEDAEHLIATWRDRPTPAGLAPLPRRSSLRGARGYRVDLEAGTTTAEPLAFCFSHPDMLLPAYPAGAPFELSGMGPHERMRFTLPPVDLSLRLQLGARAHDLPLVPDTLCVFPDHARFYVVARRAFVYEFIPERLRRITVRAAPPAGPTPAITLRAVRADPGVAIAPADEEMAPIFDALLALNPMTEIVESLPLCPSG